MSDDDWEDLFDRKPSKNGKKFNGEESKRRRDDGIERVLRNEGTFACNYYKIIIALPRGWEGTNEDIRKGWTYPQPHHPNAWGAVCNGAKRYGLIVDTDERVHMTAKKAHSRITHKFRRV